MYLLHFFLFHIFVRLVLSIISDLVSIFQLEARFDFILHGKVWDR